VCGSVEKLALTTKRGYMIMIALVCKERERKTQNRRIGGGREGGKARHGTYLG